MKNSNRWTSIVATLVLCAAGALDAATLAYWRFEDGTNGQPITSVADSSGNGYTLTEGEAGSVTSVTNPGFHDPVRRTGATNNLSACFDAGVTNGWLRNNSFTGINGLNNFTVEFFIRTPTMLGDAAILTVNTLLITEEYQYDGNLWIHVSNCQNWLGNYLKISPYDAPHHIAVVRAGTGPGASEGAYYLYVDGALDPSSGRPGDAITTTPWGYLEVGHVTGNGAVGPTRNPFTGAIDEIRISDVALRPGEFLNAPRHEGADAFAGSPIFDWCTRSCWYDPPINAMVLRTDGVRNCPFPGVVGGDYPEEWEAYYVAPWGFYPQMFASNYPLAMMMDRSTAPLTGTNSDALSVVVSNLTMGGLRLNFVFADFELGLIPNAPTNVDYSDFRNYQDFWECSEMVRQIRASADTNINSSYAGCYPYYPGNTEPGWYPWCTNHTLQSEMYLNSGMDCALPDCYPYAYLDQLTLEYSGGPAGYPDWGTNICPSVRDALFYGPLEKLSEAKRNLPLGHKLIPFILGFCAVEGYTTNAPPKEDTQAVVIHYRLRGADGYYTLPYYQSMGGPPADGYYNESTYLSDADYVADMLSQWQSLDDFFAIPGATTLLNLDTVRTSAIHWSGAIRGQTAKIIVSNLGSNSADRVQYPGGYGLPPYSDYVPAGQHQVFTYDMVWTNLHIGASEGDSAVTYSAPTYTVNGKGAGIAWTADAFRFMYLPMTGDCAIVARVTNFDGTAYNARAGVMMRASTNANAIEISSLFMPHSNRVYLHRRTSTGGYTAMSYAAAAALPYWVKLARSDGNVFSAYQAADNDGAPGDWTQVGSPVTIGGWTATTPVLVGLAVTSGSTYSTKTAAFDGVSITVP